MFKVEPQLSSSGDVLPEVASGGDVGSDVTQVLRGGASVTHFHHPEGMFESRTHPQFTKTLDL